MALIAALTSDVWVGGTIAAVGGTIVAFLTGRFQFKATKVSTRSTDNATMLTGWDKLVDQLQEQNAETRREFSDYRRDMDVELARAKADTAAALTAAAEAKADAQEARRATAKCEAEHRETRDLVNALQSSVARLHPDETMPTELDDR